MIIDTTYLLPLVGISVNSDLFSAVEKGTTNLDFDDTQVSEISLFEIQAKSAKLAIAHSTVVEALSEIESVFEIVPFGEKSVIQASFELRKKLPDYIDCVIIASAISRKTAILTEDRSILALQRHIGDTYGISVLNIDQMIRHSSRI